MAELLKDVDLCKKGASGTVKGKDALKGKLVALYFSAHWCGPCRRFTPILRAFYEELRAKGEAFEVVFVSSDGTPEDLASYVAEAHGDWYYLPHGSEWIKKLDKKYNVDGIPTLLVIKADGEVISKDGVEEITPPMLAFKGWQECAEESDDDSEDEDAADTTDE